MANVEFVQNHGTLAISGSLNRHSVVDIQNSPYQDWFALGAINVDLNRVEQIDSAGLAWLFYLLEQADKYHCQLSFSQIPEKLKKLIALSGVEGLLPFSSD